MFKVAPAEYLFLDRTDAFQLCGTVAANQDPLLEEDFYSTLKLNSSLHQKKIVRWSGGLIPPDHNNIFMLRATADRKCIQQADHEVAVVLGGGAALLLLERGRGAGRPPGAAAPPRPPPGPEVRTAGPAGRGL